MPVVAAERATGQAHLHCVVELPIARKYLDFAVTQEVVGPTDPRSDLFSKTEVQIRESGRIVRGQAFLVEANAHVERQAAKHLPRVLDVEFMRVLRSRASIRDCLAAHLEIAVQP